MAVSFGDPPQAVIGITAEKLAEALKITDAALVERLLPVAYGLVVKYAPDAPLEIRNEAIIRCAGWLKDQPSPSIRSEKTGDIETAYATTNTNALKASGAMSLLAPWRVYRAGTIG